MKKRDDRQRHGTPAESRRQRRERRLEVRKEVLRNLSEAELAVLAGGKGGCWYSALYK